MLKEHRGPGAGSAGSKRINLDRLRGWLRNCPGCAARRARVAAFFSKAGEFRKWLSR